MNQPQQEYEALKKSFFDRVKQEFDLLDLHDVQTLRPSSLEYLEEIYDISDGDPAAMFKYVGILVRLIDKMPLSNLYEHEMEEIDVDNGDGTFVKQLRHKRYPHIWKSNDGKYINDHGVVYVNQKTGDRQYRYLGEPGSQNSSAIYITFPYYPVEKIIFYNTGE